MAFHRKYRLLTHPLERPAPPGMDGGDGTRDRIIQEYGRAVSRTHPDGHPFEICHEGVEAFQILADQIRPVHLRYLGAVHLMSRDDGIRKDGIPPCGEGLYPTA